MAFTRIQGSNADLKRCLGLQNEWQFILNSGMETEEPRVMEWERLTPSADDGVTDPIRLCQP